MKKSNQQADTSYFKALLMSNINEHYPNESFDSDFIESRSALAEQSFETAIRDGKNILEAEEIATEMLFNGLHFSVTSLLMQIITEEFSLEVEGKDVKEVVGTLLPTIQDILEKYNLTDDFDEHPQYDALYTELTGAIQLYLEEYGI